MPTWVNGIGQSLGDSIVTDKPLLTSLTTYFVNSATGSDSGSTNGLDPDSPFATLVFAAATAAIAVVTPIIVLMSGHTETLASTLTIPGTGWMIVGAGQSAGKPTVKLKLNASNQAMISTAFAGFQLRNVWVQTNTQSSNIARVKFTGANGLVKGCYFECGALDLAAGLEAASGANGLRVEDTTFISTATALASKPTYGFLTSAAVTDMFLENCTFSEGTYGFSTLALSLGATVTRLTVENLSLLLGANATFGAATGCVMPTTVTGAGTVSYSGGA